VRCFGRSGQDCLEQVRRTLQLNPKGGIMIRKLTLGCALAAATTSPIARAADGDEARLSVGVTGGTLGIGPEVGYRLSKTIGVRANATFLSVNHSFDSNDIAYDGRVKLQSGGAMVDVYPFGGGFRLSGGLRINGNKARGIGEPNDGTSFDINGTTYTAGEIGTLRADTDINSVAPALTLGYGGGLVNGVYFGVEAGALFQGSVKIKPLTITGTCSASPTPAGCGDILEDLEQERLSVNDYIHKYKVYPILQLSLGYRF